MRLHAVTGAVLLAGCGFIRDPIAIDASETEHGVFGVLYAGSDTATILVAEFPPTPPPGDFGWKGVSGATVRLVAGQDTIALSELSASAPPCVTLAGFGANVGRTEGCYRAILPATIQPGSTYGLVVDIPQVGRISGITTVPQVPVIDAPTEGTTFTAEFTNDEWPSMLLRISPGALTERLEAMLIESDPNRVCEAHFLEGTAFVQGLMRIDPEDADSVPALFRAACHTSTGRAPLGQLPVTIRVVAFDANYEHFARVLIDEHSDAVLRRHTRSGIDRGVGYFAGAAVAERRIVLTGSGNAIAGAMRGMY